MGITREEIPTRIRQRQVPTRNLGNSGLKVPILGLGTWITFGEGIDDETALEIAKAAFDAGIYFFDTAESYADGKAEIALGKIVKAAGWKRSQVVISTKLFFGPCSSVDNCRGPNDYGLSRKHIIEGMKESLERLQMDYVDVVFCHRSDPTTPMEEIVRAMNFLIDQGMIFYWGTSEWGADEIIAAHEIAARLNLIAPIVEQPEYSMVQRETVDKEYKRLFEEYSMGTTIWSPLAGGLLAGKYADGVPEGSRFKLAKYEALKSLFGGDATIEMCKKLKGIAEKIGCSSAQLALAWCLKNPNVTVVLLGASKVEQLKENIQALQYVDALTPKIMAEIDCTLLKSTP